MHGSSDAPPGGYARGRFKVPAVAATVLVSLVVLQASITTGFTVCVIPDPPWTICAYNVTDRLSFAGYDVEMFRFMASQVGWVEPVDHDKGVAGTVESGFWAFRCSTLFWGDVMDQMAGKTDHQGPDTAPCAVAIGDIISQAKRYNLGVQFSAPYHHTGLAIMVATAPPAPFNKWGFLRPFNWTLWLALGLTLLIMPALVWFVEIMNLYGHIPLTKASASGIKQATYDTIMACFNIGVYQVTTLPAQVVIIVYLFLMLITISSYTANLAAVFTNAGGVVVTINSWRDLRDLPVGTPSTYIPGLQMRYGLKNMIPGNGANLDQLIAGKQGLLNGSMSAYVTNLESLQRFLGSDGYNTDCSLALLRFDPVEPAFNFAFAFHSLFPRDLVNTNVSDAVMLAEETGLIYFLHEKYLHYENSCVPLPESESVSFNQLSGLWIMLAAALGLALLWTITRVIVVARRHMRDISKELADISDPQVALEAAPSIGGDSRTKLMSKAMSRVFIKPSATMQRYGSGSDSGGDLSSPNVSRRTPLGFESRRSTGLADSMRSVAGGGGTVAAVPPSPVLPPQPPLRAMPPGRLGSGLGMSRLGSMRSVSDDFPVVCVDEDIEEEGGPDEGRDCGGQQHPPLHGSSLGGTDLRVDVQAAKASSVGRTTGAHGGGGVSLLKALGSFGRSLHVSGGSDSPNTARSSLEL